MTLTRDKFFEKFPWTFELPERPTCTYCWCMQEYKLIERGDRETLFVVERHADHCPRSGMDGKASRVVSKEFVNGKIVCHEQ